MNLYVYFVWYNIVCTQPAFKTIFDHKPKTGI